MFKKNQFSVGVDIGTHAIKLAKLKFSKDMVQIVDFFTTSVQPNLLQAIKSTYDYQDAKLINISVSGPLTIIRYANFPKMQEDELKKSIRFEAQKFIPFSVSEVNLDVAVLKKDLPDNKMLVALAAVKKDYISQRIKLVEGSGFKLDSVDIDSLALINAFNYNCLKSPGSIKTKTVALLNIGSTFSNLNILEEGVPLLSRDLNIAGNNFTQKVSDIFAIDLKTAENLKVSPDKERLPKIIQAAENVLSGLATEIRVSFDYYESQSASSVGKIYLSGGGSLFPGLKEMLANLLGIEVDYWDPLKEINIPSSIDSSKLKSQATQFAVAIGLALRA